MSETNSNIYQQPNGEEIGARISKTYKLINSLEKPGYARTNKRTGQVLPWRLPPHEREQIRLWREELEQLTRRQSERIRLQREYQQSREGGERARQEQQATHNLKSCI